MEFQHNLVVHEINPITKEVTKKSTNPIPSAILLNVKIMTIFIRM
jgi:hypothetical protein